VKWGKETHQGARGEKGKVRQRGDTGVTESRRAHGQKAYAANNEPSQRNKTGRCKRKERIARTHESDDQKRVDSIFFRKGHS